MTGEIQKEMEEVLQRNLSPQILEIVNESHKHQRKGDETHYQILIVGEAFEGVDRVSRHRKLQELLDFAFKKGVHALSLKAYTPKEWEKKDSFSSSFPACVSKSSKVKNPKIH